MVIIGLEGFLVTGLVDYLKEKRVLVVGPTKAVAALEGSNILKVFMAIMEYRQPTSRYFMTLTKQLIILKVVSFQLYKANGLAGGKGVFVVKLKKMLYALRHLMKERTSEKGNASL